MFDLERIKRETAIQQLDYHEELGSTNDRAIQLIKQDSISLPALVLTQNQTAGRGQRDRKWWSADGSLTFTWVISDSELSGLENGVSLLPILVPLAICNAIESVTSLKDISIKWPNDLLVENQKLSGVLIETVAAAHPESGTYYAVGVGINVNNSELEALTPNDLGPATIGQDDRTLAPLASDFHPGTPASIFTKTAETTSCPDLLIAILRELEFAIQSLSGKRIVAGYNERLAFRGKEIRIYQTGQEARFGICNGVNSDGGLILQTKNQIEIIFSGTINAV